MVNKDEETKTYCVISSFNSDDGFKYFTGYKGDNVVKALCIILPQMSGYKKYFENGVEDISFAIKDDIACWINIIKFGTRLKSH